MTHDALDHGNIQGDSQGGAHDTLTLDKLEAEEFGKKGATDDQDVVIGTFKRWSASAVECYVREAECSGCYYQRFFNDKPYSCKMNLAVEQLLETLGEPSKNLLNKYG